MQPKFKTSEQIDSFLGTRKPVADPDLQIRGGGGHLDPEIMGGPVLQIRWGGGHPDSEIRGGPVSKKFFSALRASFWSKN